MPRHLGGNGKHDSLDYIRPTGTTVCRKVPICGRPPDRGLNSCAGPDRGRVDRYYVLKEWYRLSPGAKVVLLREKAVFIAAENYVKMRGNLSRIAQNLG